MKQIRLFVYYVLSLLAYQFMNVVDFLLGIAIAFFDSWDNAKKMELEAQEETSRWQKFFDQQ